LDGFVVGICSQSATSELCAFIGIKYVFFYFDFPLHSLTKLKLFGQIIQHDGVYQKVFALFDNNTVGHIKAVGNGINFSNFNLIFVILWCEYIILSLTFAFTHYFIAIAQPTNNIDPILMNKYCFIVEKSLIPLLEIKNRMHLHLFFKDNLIDIGKYSLIEYKF
jgi:hypothetical protein